MVKKLSKKLIAFFLLSITILSSFSGYALAVPTEAYIQNKGHCGYHIQMWHPDLNDWAFALSFYAVYIEGGKEHPAYCMNKNVPGVGSVDDYTVDITKLLDNPEVWRAVINGYPYKTPEELGVDDYLSAYLATKEAIYTMIYDFDIDKDFRSTDDTGKKIISAMKKIVNAAKTGTQMPSDGQVSIDKIDGFIEDGNYYSQEYRVTCGVSVQSYTITANSGLPAGSQITNMSNNVQTTFTGSEHFKIRIPKSELNKDINAILSIQAKAEIYPVFYGETRVEGTQDYAVTYDPLGDASGTVNFNVIANTGKIKVVKNDAETEKPIEGVTFQLSKKDGTVIGNATTDANGEATFSALYQDDYILKELSTNDDYILNETDFDVHVDYGKTTTKTISNEHKRGDLKIYKVDKDNNEVVLGNVEFQLYSVELEKVVGTYRTNVNGELEIKNLRTGDYKLIETETNRWYDLAEDTELKIEWNNVTNVTVENELKKGQVKVIKVDKDNNEIKLEGVEFEILDENDNVLEKIITNENGEALTSRYPVRDYSKLKLHESKTLKNYVLLDEEETIELKENEVIEVTLGNEQIKGFVEVTKLDSKTKQTLEGAKFGIYDINDNLIETLQTDTNGMAISDYLYKGEYYLKELETGSVYYLLNEDKFDFEIKNHDEIIELVVENEPTDITVDVNKIGTVEIKPGDMVDYTFSNVANNSNVYLDNFKWFDYIPTDYVRLQSMATGTWNQDLTYNVYYKTNKSEDYILFKEGLSTNENYNLDFTTIEFAEDEYITETMFDFGKVEKGFRESTSPTMNCKSLNTLKDGDTFTNHTKTVGVYFGVTAEADSDWSTIVHIPTPIPTNETPTNKTPTLPRTGK